MVVFTIYSADPTLSSRQYSACCSLPWIIARGTSSPKHITARLCHSTLMPRRDSKNDSNSHRHHLHVVLIIIPQIAISPWISFAAINGHHSTVTAVLYLSPSQHHHHYNPPQLVNSPYKSPSELFQHHGLGIGTKDNIGEFGDEFGFLEGSRFDAAEVM